jgi:hypothetical protein
MRILSFITLFLFAFRFSGQCQKTESEQILQIRYDDISGNKYGSERHLVITKDSVLYDSRTWIYNTSVKIHIPINYISWSDLIGSINLEDFDTIINGNSQIADDGVDTSISIQTSKKIHKELNGNLDNTNAKNLNEKIAKIISRLKDYF